MAITTYSELQTAIANELRRASDAILTSTVIQERIALCENRMAKRLSIRAMEQQIDLPIQGHASGGTAGGSANALTLTPSPAWTAYAYGNRIRGTIATTNTGATTLNVSGLGAKNVYKSDDDSLEAANLIDGHEHEFFYDGSDFRLVPFGGLPLPSRYIRARRVVIHGDPTRKLEYLTPDNFYDRYLSAQTAKPKAFTVEGEFMVFGPRPDASYQLKMLYYRRLNALANQNNVLLADHEELYLYGSIFECAVFLGNQGLQLQYATLFDEACDRIESADKRDRHATPAPQVRSAVQVI